MGNQPSPQASGPPLSNVYPGTPSMPSCALFVIAL